jgi:hypothetical protein
LVATRLTDDDAVELEALVKRKREILTEEGAEPLSDDETATWERLLGKAAGDPGLFDRKRRDAQANAKLDELKEERRLANLPKRPLYAEPGSASLPEYACHAWLVDDGALAGNWTLMDVGLLVAILGAFWNDDPSVFVNGRFDGEGDERTLVVPGGVWGRLPDPVAFTRLGITAPSRPSSTASKPHLDHGSAKKTTQRHVSRLRSTRSRCLRRRCRQLRLCSRTPSLREGGCS